ncbi:NUMOD4 domain-containing protein [Priestia filamentosa]|uniref:NUMOD4 domain-containing protein n=1 Tax=Priestia filamentosa TaxID=1402861 RepID=UPI003982884E
MNEIWKPVKGYEDLYEISHLGRIKSLERRLYDSKGNFLRVQPEIIRTNETKSKRYKQFHLSRNNKRKNVYIHRLVAEHFIDNPFNKPHVNHIDGNKTNNHYTNLEWVTLKENTIHAGESKLMEYGSSRYNSKLNDDSVREIRRLYKEVKSFEEIARMFGVTRATIKQVIDKKTWKHVD